MSYELHIKRNPLINLEEWLKSVETTDGVKIDGSDWAATNPLTGKEVRIPGSPDQPRYGFLNSANGLRYSVLEMDEFHLMPPIGITKIRRCAKRLSKLPES